MTRVIRIGLVRPRDFDAWDDLDVSDTALDLSLLPGVWTDLRGSAEAADLEHELA